MQKLATAMLEKRRQRLLRQKQEKKKGKEKSKEDLADYEMGGPETSENGQVCYRFDGSSKY